MCRPLTKEGGQKLRNGELLDTAEREGYEVLVSTDTSLKYQQNLTARRTGVDVPLSTSWLRIRQVIPSIVAAIDAAVPGSYAEVEIPYRDG